MLMESLLGVVVGICNCIIAPSSISRTSPTLRDPTARLHKQEYWVEYGEYLPTYLSTQTHKLDMHCKIQPNTSILPNCSIS
jgi:hypothetical protein